MPPSIRRKAISISSWAILRICFFCCSVSAGRRPPRPRLRFRPFGDISGFFAEISQIMIALGGAVFQWALAEKKKGRGSGEVSLDRETYSITRLILIPEKDKALWISSAGFRGREIGLKVAGLRFRISAGLCPEFQRFEESNFGGPGLGF